MFAIKSRLLCEFWLIKHYFIMENTPTQSKISLINAKSVNFVVATPNVLNAQLRPLHPNLMKKSPDVGNTRQRRPMWVCQLAVMATVFRRPNNIIHIDYLPNKQRRILCSRFCEIYWIRLWIALSYAIFSELTPPWLFLEEMSGGKRFGSKC